MKTDKVLLSYICNENYDEMTETTTGRYCNTCQHCVVDFTKTKNTEVKHKSKNVYCGRFTIYQVENPYNNWKDYFVRFAQCMESTKISFFPLKKAMIKVGLFSLILVGASSCIMGVRTCHSSDDYDINDNKADKKSKKNDKESKNEKN